MYCFFGCLVRSSRRGCVRWRRRHGHGLVGTVVLRTHCVLCMMFWVWVLLPSLFQGCSLRISRRRTIQDFFRKALHVRAQKSSYCFYLNFTFRLICDMKSNGRTRNPSNALDKTEIAQLTASTHDPEGRILNSSLSKLPFDRSRSKWKEQKRCAWSRLGPHTRRTLLQNRDLAIGSQN